eukprot:TRINITY_DN19789_c0_g1_i3.p1 TRINITY_DN19789_c0_g1~~TRINITY_DN19789_c0_g1_i3.p1  ORF type:complete len:295 (-),score=52.08 TRINITY_DN19789_c0_g1_i3:247-1131(-)
MGGCTSTESATSHSQASQEPPSIRASSPGNAMMEECPICYMSAADVELLPHKSMAAGDVSGHRACRKCREQLVHRNSPCPWCRTEMVWQTVFGFLDGLKNGTTGYQDGQHNELASLMEKWQEYEMSRSPSDIKLFAREMASDAAIVARLEGALVSNSGWLRDSAGLWIRFYALYADGELELDAVDGERLQRAVDSSISIFEKKHGSFNHPHFVGAMYQQAAVALLCARTSGLSTATLQELVKRVGEATLRTFKAHHSGARDKSLVRERLDEYYAEAVSETQVRWCGALLGTIQS